MSTKKIQIIGSLGTGGEKIYKQNEEPVDVPDGTLWLDMDAEIANVDTDATLTQENKAADAKAVGEAIDKLNDLVGNTSVKDQIDAAIAAIDNFEEVRF